MLSVVKKSFTVVLILIIFTISTKNKLAFASVPKFIYPPPAKAFQKARGAFRRLIV